MYVIYLGYNGNYFGTDYVIGNKRYAHETSRENAKRFDTKAQAQYAITNTLHKCANVDKKDLIIEEVNDEQI